MGIIKPLARERRPQFEQRVGAAHFLHREDVRTERANALADFGPGRLGFRRTIAGGFIEIVFQVVGGNGKGSGQERRADERGNQEERAAGGQDSDVPHEINLLQNGPAKSKGGRRAENFLQNRRGWLICTHVQKQRKRRGSSRGGTGR